MLRVENCWNGDEIVVYKTSLENGYIHYAILCGNVLTDNNSNNNSNNGIRHLFDASNVTN